MKLITTDLPALQKVTTWYSNNVKAAKAEDDPETSRGIKSYTRMHTKRDTCKHLFKDRIHEAVMEKTAAPPGGPEWLKHYAVAQATVFNSLNEEELEECSELAEKWNDEGLSKAKQQR